MHYFVYGDCWQPDLLIDLFKSVCLLTDMPLVNAMLQNNIEFIIYICKNQ